MRNKRVVELKCFDNFKKEEIQTKSFYNYFPSKVLKNTHGIQNALFPKNPTNATLNELNISGAGISKIEGVGYFKQYFPKEKYMAHRLLIYADDKKMYINQMIDDNYDLFWLYNLKFESTPLILPFKKDDEDSVIMVSDDTMKIWTTMYSPYTIKDVPQITSMCMNDSVLFCTIKDPAHKVWYATDLTAENVGQISTTSGYISLEDNLGEAKKVIAFNESVYVFRDYGISKINYIKGESLVTQVYMSNTKIYANTVSVCGNNILFMTKEGLNTFNGVKVKKADMHLFNEVPIENSGAVASAMGEKYYLALNLNFEDNKNILCEPDCVNNVLIILDTNDFSYEIIRGVDIKSMTPVQNEEFEKMLVIFNTGHVDKIGEIVKTPICFDENLPKFWESESLTTDMNVKLFTKLKINADKGVKTTLNYDDKKISFTTYKSGINEFVFKIICKDIKIEISSFEQSGIVEKVELEYYEY